MFHHKSEQTTLKKRTDSRPSAARKPAWLKVRYTINDDFQEMRDIVRKNQLHTVCEQAHCPNQGECWRHRTATIMILGDACTRNCRFCAVRTEKPQLPDPAEPDRVAQAVALMGLKYAVITSVTRDDLPDYGAEQWAMTIRAIRRRNPHCKIEILIPDFNGDKASLKTVLTEKPDVLGHNLETVHRLYPLARPQADYSQSLAVLEHAKVLGVVTKTGIMVGLGETDSEIYDLMKDARRVDCDIFTAGQYLQPTINHLPVERFFTPIEFRKIEDCGRRLGFRGVLAGPLVRSSYHAEQLF